MGPHLTGCVLLICVSLVLSKGGSSGGRGASSARSASSSSSFSSGSSASSSSSGSGGRSSSSSSFGSSSGSYSRGTAANTAMRASIPTVVVAGAIYSPAMPFHTSSIGVSYYWHSSYYVSRPNYKMCVEKINETDEDFKNLHLENGTRVYEIAYGCPASQNCCDFDCCNESGGIVLLIVVVGVFVLIGIVLLVRCCFNRNRDNRCGCTNTVSTYAYCNDIPAPLPYNMPPPYQPAFYVTKY